MENHGKVDRIYSDLDLSAGHKYFIRVSDEPARPRIVKLYKEVT